MLQEKLTELLSSYLGHFCELQKEQLRISLWRAFRTGFSLENVSLRADAFDYLQLPFKLLSGRVGRVQVQVPWHALRSAPVVIELSDVHLCLGLLGEADLEPGPACERAWAAKQAELAVAEALALQGLAGGLSGAAAAEAAGRGGGGGEERKGLLWSFLQHLVTMLVNKLQLRVRNVHVSLQDASTGMVAGVKLEDLHTCALTEAEHLSLLAEDPLSSFVPGALGAPRGTIHKQLAVRGLSAYWAPGQGGGEPAAAPSVAGLAAAGNGLQGPGQAPDALHPLLLPLDCTLQIAAQMPGSEAERAAAAAAAAAAAEAGEGLAPPPERLRVHAAAVLHSLELSLHHGQAADMLRLADALAWLVPRNKCAAFRPAGWRPGAAAQPGSIGGRRQLCLQLWQYAVNAVLTGLRGQQDGVRWVDGAARRALRRQYTWAYSDHLAAPAPRRQGSGAALAAAGDEEGGEPGLLCLERQLTVPDIVLCRQVARELAEARGLIAPKPAAQVTPVKRPRAPQDTGPPRPTSPAPFPSPTPLHQPPPSPPDTPPSAFAAAAAPGAGPGGEWQGTERGSMETARSGTALESGDGTVASQKGYIAWGLSKMAGFLGYMPHAEGSTTDLLEPSESDVRQLYEAVDFDPEREAGLRPAQRGIQVSVDCLVSKASLVLRQPPSLSTSAATPPSPLLARPTSSGFLSALSPTSEPAGSFLSGASTSSLLGGAGAGAATGAGPAFALGPSIAALELDRVRLEVELLPEALTAGVVVADIVVHDLVSHGPGVTERMLGRLESAPPGNHRHHHHHQHPLPILRLKLNWPLAEGPVPPPTLSPVHGPDGAPMPPYHPPPPPSQQQQPTLDVLVQPLQLHYRPACLAQLQGVLPSVVPGNFHERLLAAVNGLTAEARAIEKAAYLQYLGPAIDVLVKVLDVHVLLGGADGASTSPGAVLSTGPITFHTVRQQHVQLSVDSALELLLRHRQERQAANSLGLSSERFTGQAQQAQQAQQAAAATAAAVVAVEQQLVYQQFEFLVAGVQLVAVNTELVGGGEGSAGGSVRSGGRLGPETIGGSGKRLVLQPVKLGGALRLHRITDDTSLTQVHCSLHIDPITLSLTPALALHLAGLLEQPASQQQPEAGDSLHGGASAAHTAPSAAGPVTGSSIGSSPVKPSRHLSPEVAPAGAGTTPAAAAAAPEGRRLPPSVVLDVRLTSLDASYFVQKGGRAGRVEAHAHLSLLRASAALQVFPTGLEAQVALSGLSLRDLSPEIYSLLPVKGPIPHLAKAVSLESLQLSFDGTAHGGRGSATEVQLTDLVLHGYAGELGNFITRLNERKPTTGTIIIHDSPTSLHTTINLSNLLLGHALLLRIMALVLPGEEEEQGGPRDVTDMADDLSGSPGTSLRAAGPSAASLDVTADDDEAAAADQQVGAASAASSPVPGGAGIPSSPPAAAAAAAQAAAEPALRDSADSEATGAVTVAESELDGFVSAAPPEPAGSQQQSPMLGAAAEAGGSPSLASPSLYSEASPTLLPESPSATAVRTPASPAGPAPNGLPSSPPAAAAAPAAPPAPPPKPVFTTVQLTGCRMVCKYRRGPSTGSATAYGRSGSQSALTAAARETLELHEDIVALDIPSLSLQLPLEPPPAAVALQQQPDPSGAGKAELLPEAAAAGAADWEQSQGQEEQEEEEEEGHYLHRGSSGAAATAAAFAAAGAGSVGDLNSFASLPTSRPGSRVRHSLSGTSLYTSASEDVAAPAGASSNAYALGGSSRTSLLGLPPQPLLAITGLTLSVATVGYSGRTMLPILSMPSVQLLAWHGLPPALAAGSGGGTTGDQPPTARNLAGSLAAAAGAAAAPGGSSSAAQRLAFSTAHHRPGSGASSGPAAQQSQLVACYSLAVSSMDFGAHPSHLAMAGLLVQQCQSEMALLMRDTSDMTTTEFESLPSSNSSPPTVPPAGAKGSPSAAGTLGGPVAAQPKLWQFDASVGLVGVSLLGSSPSSSCLKLEWHDLRCSASNLGSSPSVQQQPGSACGSPSPAPAVGASCECASGAACTAGASRALVLLAGEVAWREVVVYALLPHMLKAPDPLSTPFAAAAGVFDGRSNGGSGFFDLGGSANELLYHWSMGSHPSSTQQQGARRSLISGLGVPVGSPEEPGTEFHEAPSRLLGRRSASSGVSRYFSAADSDFEDAESDWGEGESPPGGASPRHPSPLPLNVAAGDATVLPLLRLVVGADAASDPCCSDAACAEGAGEASEAVVLHFTQHQAQEDADMLHSVIRRRSLEQHRICLEAQHEWGLVVASLALQVHMHGWQESLHCLLCYAAPTKELAAIIEAASTLPPPGGTVTPAPVQRTVQLPPAPSASLGTVLRKSQSQQQPAPTGPGRGVPGVGAPAQQAQQPQQGAPFGLRVELQRLVIAVVADAAAATRTQRGGSLAGTAEEIAEEEEVLLGGGAEGSRGLPDDVVPALSLTTALTLSCCVDSVGGVLLGVEVPKALLGVGVLPRYAVPAAISLPLEDCLLGLRQGEISLVVQPPSSPSGPLPAVVVAEAAAHSLPHTSVAANVFQLSVWASQRNLSMVAAVAQHAQQLAEALAPLGTPEPEADKGQAAPAAGPGARLTMKLNLHKLAVLLSLAQHPPMPADQDSPRRPRRPLTPVPLFELAAEAVSCDVHDVGVGWLEASVATRLHLDVFSASKQGWEPVLEPWQCRLEVVAPTSAGAHHQHLGISSQQGLELTLTDTATEAAGLLADAFKSVPEVYEEPETLAEVLRTAGGAASTLSAAWWLHNLTGTALELWVATPTESLDPQLLAAPPMITAPPGAKVALPVFAHGNAAHQQRHAGQPCASKGICVGPCADGGWSRSSASLDGQLAAAAASHRTLLFFRLPEQSAPCGPVQLDRLEPSVHVVTPADLGELPLRAKVVCELTEGRYGGSTITLHSGVQVHNSTELPIDVGVQTPMGLVMEPQSLGVVPPGRSFWLPVLRAEAGLLCIRPSAGATHTVVTTVPDAAAAAAAAALQTAGLAVPTALAPAAAAAAAALTHGHSLPAAEAGAAGLGLGLAVPPRPSSPAPPLGLHVLYASGRLSPARGSLDRNLLQQLESAASHAAQLGGGSGDGGHASLTALAAAGYHRHEWSSAVPLQQLLRVPGGESGGGGLGPAALEAHRPTRQLVCHPAAGLVEEVSMIFSMGTSLSGGDGLVWDVTISPPLTLHNALPVPVDVTLKAWMKSHLLSLRPNQHVGIHQLEASHVESLVFKALGYHPTDPITPNPIASSGLGGQEVAGGNSTRAPSTIGGDGGGTAHEVVAPETLLQLEESGHSHSRVEVSLRHSLNVDTGCHTLRLGCTLWVYNLTGLPISLRQSVDDPLVLRAAEMKQEEDSVPGCWVPPLSLRQQAHPHVPPGGSSTGSTPLGPRLSSPLRQLTGLRSVSREGMRSMHSVPNLLSPSVSAPAPPPAAPSMSPSSAIGAGSRQASTLDMPGLGEILAEEGDARQMAHSLKRQASRARGIADSMESAPHFETPSRWPSMHGGLLPHRHRLRIQVRATQCKASEGRTYWSDSVELDATVGGAAVVTAPAPLLPPACPLPAPKAAYMMSVTAAQVPGSAGALALYLLPRYLLHNALDMPIQYKQQGTGVEKELGAGAARPLRCADASRALRLCVRVQEAGWLWSGGFALDTPGDLFIKIRHRDRGVTMLVRVDVAASESGVLVVTLSHHPAGFAPYRIENCTLLTLHARQHRCREQQDVLRPYCSLNYAWDEPALPHKLVLELPGSKHLGTFMLDKVGQDVLLSVRVKNDEPERQVRVLVRAEGPTRVLTVLDVNRHSLAEEIQPRHPAALLGGLARLWPPHGHRGGSGGSAGAEGAERGAAGTAGGTAAGEGRAAAAVAAGAAPTGLGGPARTRAVPSGLLWEVSADLASVGLSLASPSSELCYLRAGQLRTTVAVSAARLVVDLEVRTLQVDNPSRWVAHPVTLVLPAPASRLASTAMAAAKLEGSRKPAVVLQLAVWQRRPAGVICIEHADLQVAPLGIFVEQQHALQLAAFLSTLSASLRPPHAASASSGSGYGGGGQLGQLGGYPLSAHSGAGSRAMSVNGDLPSPATAGMLTAVLGAGIASEAGQLQLQLPADLQALLSGVGQAGVPQGQKVYIDIMRMGPLEITLSFLPAPWDPQSGGPRVQALQRLLSLAEVEDAHLRLAGLTLRHPLLGTAALAQHLQRHYMKAALPELYKVVGAANVFGDPVRLVHHLGLGVWSFLASPAAGLVESARQRGPRQFVAGLVSGTQSLFANVVFAFSNAATKGSGAARKFIVVLGLDRYDRNWASSTFRRRLRFHEQDRLPAAADAAAGGAGLPAFAPRRRRAVVGGGAETGVLGAVMRGIVGVISEPIRGVDEGGLAGLLLGLKRGVLGFVVIPLASLLEMSASMADSIRRAVAGTSCIAWVRPPRYVCPGEPLPPYNWDEAMGRWLLSELDRMEAAEAGAQQAQQAQQADAFVLCVPAAAKGHYLVATTRRVLYIHAREPMWYPLVRWSAALGDLELVRRRGSALSMVAQHAERTHFVRSMWDQVSEARAKPRGPWSFLGLECETQEEAARFEGWVLAAMRSGVHRRVTLLGHAQLLNLW